ncbi:MAG TPA: 3-hydroxyacyl-CoA dehydrogenase NAD-binding domain-containing protein [Bacteroidota bacterium]|nr:3-hydroxyacyl-CoA dehydrogenase NAD-binding domain-containing protein [Bacteroidota bacterium]
MTEHEGTTLGVVGAGTMGAGISEVAALAGFNVVLNDVSNAALDSAARRIKQDLNRSVEKDRITAVQATEAFSRIRLTMSLTDLRPCGCVIEAAIENLPVKKDLFARLSDIVSDDAILASNTSSFSITSLASSVRHPERVVGMHFFNPPPVMKLVEVVRGARTSDTTLEHSVELARRLGKTPVVCKDTPGFIVNRVARPFYGEALRLLGEGVASVEEIDRIVKLEGGFRMGPFELMDLIGIDVNYAVTQSVYEQFFHEPRFRPHPLQRQMVEAGMLGRKTGRGFYTYSS